MIKKLKQIIIILLFALIFQSEVSASIKINEIYPAPPTGEFEWIELYNNEDNNFDLALYSLYDLAGNKIKLPATILSSHQFVIATCSSVLNNGGDTVFLKSNLGTIIEIATYSGSFTAEKSYGRCPDGAGQWMILNLITKNSGNSEACFLLTPTVVPTDTIMISPSDTPVPTSFPTSEPTPEPTPVSFDNIFISEAMVNPATGENEWIEFYNQNDFTVELIDWYVDDQENSGSSPKKFSLTMIPNSFSTLDLTASVFNNGGDSVRLLDFNKNIKDSFEYGSSEKNISWGRINFESDQYCFQNPSKNMINNSCLYPEVKNSITTTLINTSIPSTQINRPITQPKVNYQPVFKSSPLLMQRSTSSVLGAKTTKKISNKNNNNQHIISSLSFASLSYSVLTIVSIFLKIKLHEGI